MAGSGCGDWGTAYAEANSNTASPYDKKAYVSLYVNGVYLGADASPWKGGLEEAYAIAWNSPNTPKPWKVTAQTRHDFRDPNTLNLTESWNSGVTNWCY